MPNQYTFSKILMVSEDGIEYIFKSKKHAAKLLQFDSDNIDYFIKNSIEFDAEIPTNLE